MKGQGATTGANTSIDWGVASVLFPGEAVTGDHYVVQPFPNGVLLAVLDGVGHGAEAAEAARIAAEHIKLHAHESVVSIVKRCHEALNETRGIALSVVSLNVLVGTTTWLAVGNVEGRLLRANPNGGVAKEKALLRGGIVGLRLPPLRASVHPLSPGNLVILATDGVARDFDEGLVLTDPPQKLADQILRRHCKGDDDALVLVARYLGSPP